MCLLNPNWLTCTLYYTTMKCILYWNKLYSQIHIVPHIYTGVFILNTTDTVIHTLDIFQAAVIGGGDLFDFIILRGNLIFCPSCVYKWPHPELKIINAITQCHNYLDSMYWVFINYLVTIYLSTCPLYT